jgi:hypothetical protein
VTASVHLQAEFNFKESVVAHGLRVQCLQNLFAGLIAVFIYCLVSDVIYIGLLELILLLVLLRERESIKLSSAVDSLVVQNKSVTASINGQKHPLSACELDYFSRYLALVSLTTVAGQTYRRVVFPDLFDTVKYRQLIALLKAAPLRTAPTDSAK